MASAEILAAGLEEGRAKQVSACIALDGRATIRHSQHGIHHSRTERLQATNTVACISAVELGGREASAMGPRH